MDAKMNIDKIKYFLMFMGYPRSGHTLVASMLNAHPNVICSNQLFIIQNADKRNLEGLLENIKNGAADRYWKPEVKIAKAPKTGIHVIGDKTGHRTVEYLIDNPEQLGNLKSIVPWPLKWIHVVRNPFDCLSTWTKKNFESRQKKVPRYSMNNEFDMAFQKFQKLNEKIAELKKSEDVLTLVHEKVVINKDNTMKQLCDFLEIEMDANWRDRVVKTLWKKPRITRRNISWDRNMRNKVMNRSVKKFPWLKGYYFGG